MLKNIFVFVLGFVFSLYSCTSDGAKQDSETGASLTTHSAEGESDGWERETGNKIYDLPRDHAMHAGDWYKGAEYQETNYFTGFFRDKKTNKPYSVFFCWSVYGYDAKLNRPLWVALFAFTDIEQKKFMQAVHVMPGKIDSRGSGITPDPKDFFAEYSIQKGADSSEGVFSYKSADESWRWMASVPNPNKKLPNEAFFLDVNAKVTKPGYHCPVPYGFTQEGAPTELNNNVTNPFSGAGLSWYIIAPIMQTEAKVKVGEYDLDLEGQIYYEHQWGRIRTPGMEQARYFWGWAKMNDGRIMNWRTYRDVKTGKYVPELNRFNVVYPDGKVQYWMGPAFTYEPKRSWKSPVTGVDYHIEGLMKTPVGNYYVKPVVDVAEAQLLNGGMWEGASRLYKDNASGPVVGWNFSEHMWAPFDSPVGKDIPYNPKFTGQRDSSLPAAPDFTKYINW